MSKPTYLVALTDENTRQIDAIVRAVCEISAPTDARIVIAHVFTHHTYQRALRELDEEPKTPLEKRFTELLPAHPGTEDDVPEWVKRWSQQQIRGDHDQPQDSDDLSQSEAVERVLYRKNTLQQVAEAFDSAGIEYEIRGAIGDPVDQLMLMVEEVDADIVVVSARDWPDIRQAVFSSTAQQILRSAPCPVLSVRESTYDVGQHT
jgi:nucleotide-binding universal stress UspA family protein